MHAASKDLISIIVPVYNVAQYLDRCVESIVQQTYQNIEIILIDDGSTDESGDMCEKWIEKDKRIKVIHKENGGLSDARNIGVEQAAGKYIGFVDSDDYIDPKMYEILYDALIENDADMAICNYCWVDEAGKTVNYIPIVKSEALDAEQCLNQLSTNKNVVFVTAVNKLYKRFIFDNQRFPKGRIHEDEFTAHHFISQCTKIAIVNEDLYFYLQRNGSITHRKLSVQRVDAVYAMLDRYLFFHDRGEKKNANHALRRAYGYMFHALNRLPFSENKELLNQATGETLRQLRLNPRSIKLIYAYLKARFFA